MASDLADADPSVTPGNNGCGQVDDGSQSRYEAAGTATSPATGTIESAPGKKKSGRRPRRKKKPHMPASQSEQGQGRQKNQNNPSHTSSLPEGQQQRQQRENRQHSFQPKEAQKNASAAHAQPKAAPEPGPGAAAEINKSLSVAMMANPLFPLPFPLMPVLGVTLLATQGKPSSERKKGYGVDVKLGGG
ncbi:hypothetical protein PspLS_00086 [Pyricularia sp. CBS 133598]|nr:hypothetical protein PspLS_00086 [Pyricularia sp. CBS 133598]